MSLGRSSVVSAAQAVVLTSAQSGDFTAGLSGTTYICTGTIAVTLPSAASNANGWYVIKNAGTGMVKVADVSIRLLPDESVMVASDGTSWHILDSHLHVPLWSVDRPPVTGQTEDDEFCTSSLAGKWTEAYSVSTGDFHTSVKSCWVVKHTGDGWGTLLQSYSAGTTFSVTVKMHGAVFSNTQSYRFYLWDSGETNAMGVKLTVSGGLTHAVLFSVDTSVENNRQDEQISSSWNQGSIYLHLQREASDVWRHAWSQDGISWRQGLTPTYTKAFTVAKLKIWLHQNGATVRNRMGLDWVRRDWLTV
jgi:hypothetical protein